MRRFAVTLSILSILLLVSMPTSVFAQGPGSGPGMGQGPGVGPDFGKGGGPGFGEGLGLRDGSGIINRLNRILTHAGAPELSAEQEDAIAALIESHRENRPERQRDQANADLHDSYTDAILAGDLEAAKELANQIAQLMTEHTAERLQAQAEFQIQLLGVLDPTSQLALLIEKEGTRGILRLLGPNWRRGPGGRSGFGMGGRPGNQK